jgi:hypothetical protein
MRVLQSILRILLGMALILHGLASAVIPLRGADAIAAGRWNPLITIACVIAVIGFVAAGLGVLRVVPFDRWRVPLALGASLSGLAAQTHLPVGQDMVIGWTLSAAFALAVMLMPVAPTTLRAIGPWVRTTVGWAFMLWVAAASMLFPFSRTWGATADDWHRTLPGDHQPRTPQFEILHAVTIAAPPERVWERLVQLGQDRAGFYSYDWLERAFGVDIRNSTVVRPEWQQRLAGDRVPATQAGYMGGVFGDRPGWNVKLVEPNRVLVLDQWGAFVLIPTGNQTRFLVRSTISNERISPPLAAINWSLFEMPHFIMQRRMLLRIKELAEQS